MSPTIQTQSNIQSLIEQCVNVMPHQMKGIKDENNMSVSFFQIPRGQCRSIATK
jgi:hypothetical protein